VPVPEPVLALAPGQEQELAPGQEPERALVSPRSQPRPE